MANAKGWKNPRRGYRQKRLCSCGCGEPVAEMYDAQGKFRGYLKRAPGHAGVRTAGFRAKLSVAMGGMGHPLARPIGSRRVTRRVNTDYWEVKVAGQRRWVFEHRHIMEQLIGRPLTRQEHVHHLNSDGLDNRPENLVLMSASEHATLTGKETGGPQVTTARYRRRHRCSICGVEHDWPTD